METEALLLRPIQSGHHDSGTAATANDSAANKMLGARSPSPDVDEETTTGISGLPQPLEAHAPSHNGLRCCIDIYNPRPGTCDSTVDTDDRQVVSDFFGRNKSATTNIPEDYYLCLCRKHYQQPEYRNEEAQNAKMRCVAIVYTTRKMMNDGRWAGFELQLSKQEYDRIEHGRDVEGEAQKYNERLAKDKEEKAGDAHRKHKKKVPNAVPDWMHKKWLVKNPRHDTYPSFSGREGVRYNGNQLIEIVSRICQDCVERGVGMPAIEAVPVTWGQICEWERQQAKRERTAANTRVRAARQLARSKEKQSSIKDDAPAARAEIENVLKQVEKAELALRKSITAAKATAHTLPQKRPSRRPTTKLHAEPQEDEYYDEGDDEEEASIAEGEPLEQVCPTPLGLVARAIIPVTPSATDPIALRSSTRSSLRRKRAAQGFSASPDSPSKKARRS